MALAGAAALICLGACASKPPPPAASPRAAAPAPEPKRLAWLPVETLEMPDVARTVNDHLGRVKISGATDGRKAAVSMEVAQLAIECTEPTPACYGAVGNSLGADQLLWAELHPGPARAPTIRIALALFDVRAGTAPKRVEKTFDGVQAARAGVADLVDHAFEGGRGSR